jgi:protein-S-isoprenylcysteine O-methyltransferase Ste14
MAPWTYFGSALLVLLVSFVVFRVAVRRDYLRFGRLRPLIAFLEYLAIGVWVYFGYSNIPRGWPAVRVGFVQEVVGWILFVGGWLVALAGILSLGIRRSHGLRVPTLRQAGLYRLTRNPQAVAFLLAMTGYVVLWPTCRNAGVLVLVVVLAHLMILTEEEHLRRVFGEEFQRYCERVPRYLGLQRRTGTS